MMPTRRRMHLNAFLQGAGQHEAAWRLPGSNLDANFDVGHWIHDALAAEQAKFDSVFVADAPVALDSGGYRTPGYLDPIVLMSALAAVTSRIGLIATVSTQYSLPYNLARRMASLDHISHGRAGWNIVTTWAKAAAANFGDPVPDPHAERYERAEEFVDLVCRLWDSWEAEAYVADRESGIVEDTARIHPVSHHGKFYDVEGPLNVRRPPQGWPVLVQAGSSDTGRRFAAAHAEAIFTAQSGLDSARAFYADVKGLAAGFGRDPSRIKILPGVVTTVAATETEARQLARELDDLRVPASGLYQLSTMFEVDASGWNLDEPVPAWVFQQEGFEGWRSRTGIVETLTRQGMNVRQVISYLGSGRGHFNVVGSAEQVADVLTEWFETGAADGFNIMPPAQPASLSAFIDLVIPILQERGLFWTDYEGSTLREHYGLEVPRNSYHRLGGGIPAAVPAG